MNKLYASALHLDRRAVNDLKITDAYSLHRVVYSLFADVRSDHEKNGHIQSGIVYADQGGDIHGRKVLIVSDRKPEEQVDGKYGQVLIKEIQPDFLQYKHYQFKVQVNPVRSDGKTGKRVAVRGRDAVAQWFLERSIKSWGFEVASQSLQVDRIDVLQFKGKAHRSITLGRASIQGQLTVIDSKQFQASFKNGIGKGRAFGCGLLQIVPIIENPFA